jgi:serine/threonine-protein kinase
MDTDRNLLFGVLAFQAGIIDQQQFAEACSAWAARKNVPLAEVLLERHWLTPADRAHLDYLLERKLARHQGDARSGLATVAGAEARQSLTSLTDPDIQQSLAALDLPPCVATEVVEQRGPRLFDPAPTPEGPAAGPAPRDPSLSRGRYTLLRLHAAGGIGQVWLARDGDLGRDVALKELKPETAAHAHTPPRFLEEARITGQLEHPGIVPVYELVPGGPAQQAFYTMRFVKGRTLSEATLAYHRQRLSGGADPLAFAALLNAFVGVCNAVAYAHARGVIHRDLKGQNVILGDFGEVMVLDWGLAKVLDQPGPEGDTPPLVLEESWKRDATVQGQVLGTPVYMAPEQAAGHIDRLDRRTDVYALGAILYEILTGRPPFTLAVAPGVTPARPDTHELLRRIQEEEPPRPRQLVSGVAPALEAVCLRALAKKPERRYQSAGELAREVQRWLADEPVTAYREPLRARLYRWGRRHKALVTGLAALAVTAVAALAVSLFFIGRAQARTAEALRKSEEHYRYALDAVDRYYNQVSENPALKENSRLQGLRKSLLSTARDFYLQFLKDRAGDPALESRLTEAVGRLALIVQEIDSDAAAVRMLEEIQDVMAKLACEQPDNPALQHNLGATYHNLGVMYGNLGKRQQAEAAYQSALKVKQALADKYPDRPRFRADVAKSHDSLGTFYRQTGRPDPAGREFLRALATREQLARDHPGETAFQAELAESYNNLAGFAKGQKELARAEQFYQKALAIQRRLAKNGGDANRLMNLAQTATNLGIFYRDSRKSVPRAEEAFRLGVETYRKLTERFPDRSDYQEGLAWAYKSRSELYYNQKQFARSRADFEAYLDVQDRLAAEHCDRLKYAMDFATDAELLARLLLAAKQPTDALAWLDRAYTRLAANRTKVVALPRGKKALYEVHKRRAQAFKALQSFGAFVRELENAIRLGDGTERVDLQIEHGLGLAVMGNHRRAASLMKEVSKAPSLSAGQHYSLALVYHYAALAAREDPQLGLPMRTRLAQEYAAKAVQGLRKAQAAGFFKDKDSVRRLEAFSANPEIGPRKDFKELAAEVKAKH